MATSGTFWWMTPIQAISALSAAFNSGASGQPCFLSMPMLELPSVPAVYSGKQVNFLLARSEAVFPRINALGTVPNLALALTCFLNRRTSLAAAEKWPVLGAAFACNVGATVWTLVIMAPINNAMRLYSKKIEEDETDEKSVRLYREAQAKWKTYAVGRAVIMMLAAVAGAYSLYVDGKYL